MKTQQARPVGDSGEVRSPAMPGQVVLVLQGGGALGAYQGGVYQAMHEAGIAPDWVIGTSIGAINAALIAGNPPAHRLERLQSFWKHLARPQPMLPFAGDGLGSALGNLATLSLGVPGFFAPNPRALLGVKAALGPDAAAYYSTAALHTTLRDLVDPRRFNDGEVRMTVGAVSVRGGGMRYFDSRDEPLGLEHVLASGALPPGFPAVRIGEEWYWDGGIYSNTPIEAVFDDRPRRNSVIFAVNVWHAQGPAPESIWDVLGRHKDIQYASRDESHIERQKQIHRLRHVIRELVRQMPPSRQSARDVRDLASWGCSTVMHVVRLLAPRLDGEDHTKDIDFSTDGIEARWSAGYQDTKAMIARAPWSVESDGLEGVLVHMPPDRAAARPEPGNAP